MKFENLKQFIEANTINRMKWLREAEANDLATVMAKNHEFSKILMETVGQEGRDTLKKAKLLEYETSLLRLLQIEF
jgi:hypothetical protein